MQYISEQHSVDDLEFVFASINGELPVNYQEHYDDKVMLTFAILDTAEIEFYQKLADRVRQRVEQFDQMVHQVRDLYVRDLEQQSRLAFQNAAFKTKITENEYVHHNGRKFVTDEPVSSGEIAHDIGVGFKRFVPEQINMKTPLDTIEYLQRAHPEGVDPKSHEPQVRRLIQEYYARFKKDSPKQFVWEQRWSNVCDWLNVAFTLGVFIGIVGGFIMLVIHA